MARWLLKAQGCHATRHPNSTRYGCVTALHGAKLTGTCQAKLSSQNRRNGLRACCHATCAGAARAVGVAAGTAKGRVLRLLGLHDGAAAVVHRGRAPHPGAWSVHLLVSMQLTSVPGCCCSGVPVQLCACSNARDAYSHGQQRTCGCCAPAEISCSTCRYGCWPL